MALQKSLSALDTLTEALRRLPGIGPKSAQRMAFHLLQHDRDGAALLGQALYTQTFRAYLAGRMLGSNGGQINVFAVPAAVAIDQALAAGAAPSPSFHTRTRVRPH